MWEVILYSLQFFISRLGFFFFNYLQRILLSSLLLLLRECDCHVGLLMIGVVDDISRINIGIGLYTILHGARAARRILGENILRRRYTEG